MRYPCVEESAPKTYRCLGQFPEWNVSGANDFSLSNGVVTDSLTGLRWQQVVDAKSYTWDGAKAYCADAVLDGNSDWRLPTVTELRSLIDYTKENPAINTTWFPTTPSEQFWSASPYAGTPGFVWLVAFSDGASGGYAKGSSGRVRCVR